MDATEVDQFYAEVGRRVRAARGTLTQAQLATRLGMTRSSVANLEAGRQRIPIHTLAQLASILDVPVVDLMPEPNRAGQDEALFVDISNESESTQDFIRGALAQIGLRVAGV